MSWKKVALIAAIASLALGTAYVRHLQSPSYGLALPEGPAVFETSLQDRISSTDTSLTLVANSVRGGSALSGYQCFTIDEGRTDMEYVCGSVSGTSVTSLERGIDPRTGTTTNSAVKFAHRKGANVKVTDFPLIQRLRAIMNGSDTVPNLLAYASGTACTGASASTTLCSKAYIDATANQGAATSSESVAGIARLATALQQASSTDGGANDPLVLQSKYATSSPGGTVAALYTLILNNAGKIAQTAIDFAQTATWTALNTFTGGLTSSGATNIACSIGNLLTLNGVSYRCPNSQATASSTAMLNDGSGNLSWGAVNIGNAPRYIGNGGSFTTADSLTTGGTSTPGTLTANLLSTNGILKVSVVISAYSDSGVDDSAVVSVRFGNTTVCSVTLASGAATSYGTGFADFTIVASSSASTQFGTVHAANGAAGSASCTSSVDTTLAQDINVIATWNQDDGGNTETITINRTAAYFLGSN
jgi:hypothetical protein